MVPWAFILKESLLNRGGPGASPAREGSEASPMLADRNQKDIAERLFRRRGHVINQANR